MKWQDQMSWSSFFECWVLSQVFHYLLLPSSRGSCIPLCSLPLKWCHLYLRLLSFLPAILITACSSSSPTFRMMYSVCKLNKQGDNIPPLPTLFSIFNQSIVPCLVLTIASWCAHRSLRKLLRWSGILVSLRISQSLLWSTQLKALA